jgi:hypothetical protein
MGIEVGYTSGGRRRRVGFNTMRRPSPAVCAACGDAECKMLREVDENLKNYVKGGCPYLTEHVVMSE